MLSPEITTLSPAQEGLQRDFYASFKYAQGLGKLHELIIIGMAAYYQRSEMLPAEEIAALKPHGPSFRLPRIHHQGDNTVPREVAREAYNKWQNFADAYREARGNFADYNEKLHKWAPMILGHMITRDVRFQDRARPSQPNDPHRSYFRQYVLLGEPTSRPALDWLHTELRSRAPHDLWLTAYDELRHVLAPAWEVNHPGQSFWPETATADAGQLQTIQVKS